MLVSKAARRYAIALLELADEQNAVEKTLEDIGTIRSAITDSRELLLFLKSPIVKPGKKASVLKEVFEGKVGTLVENFLQLMARKKRSDILQDIVEAFVEEFNKFAGIIEIEARVAKPLNDSQKAELINSLEKATSKKVNLTVNVNEELKGGLTVKIDDTVIDGSVKHKLEQLEDMFLESSME